MSYKRWEYCRVSVVTYRDGTGQVTEQIEISRFNNVEQRTEHGGHGLVTVLNELGAKGWEVFDVGASVWLKRKGKFDLAGSLRAENQP